jgi:hypothetical protein
MDELIPQEKRDEPIFFHAGPVYYAGYIASKQSCRFVWATFPSGPLVYYEAY